MINHAAWCRWFDINEIAAPLIKISFPKLQPGVGFVARLDTALNEFQFHNELLEKAQGDRWQGGKNGEFSTKCAWFN